MSAELGSQNQAGKNLLSSFLGTGKMEQKTPSPTTPAQQAVPVTVATAAPRVIPRQTQQQQQALQAPAAQAQAAKLTQNQLESYVAMTAEMQTLLKQERQRTQHLHQEIRRLQEHYQGVTAQQGQQIQQLEIERRSIETAHQETQAQSAEYSQQLNRLKQELAKVGKNWEIIKKLADSKDQFEQLLTKYTDSEAKFQALFDNSAQSIRKVDEMMREIHRRFSLVESSWDIEAKQRKQGDTDVKTTIDRLYAETETVSAGLHSLHQHMGQYEIAIHALIGQIEKRDRSNHDLHRTLKQARESQERSEQALNQIASIQSKTPRPHSRVQASRLVRRIANAAQSRFSTLETQIQNGFKIAAKAIQLDAVLRRLDLLQGHSETAQASLSRIEKQVQEIATVVSDAQYDRLTQSQEQLQAEVLQRLSATESAILSSHDKIKREMDALKAENELFRSVLLRWMDENRAVSATTNSSVSGQEASVEPPRTHSPLEELLTLKENKISKLREDLRSSKSDASRKQIQLILDATLMQRDQISSILKSR